MLNDYRDKQKLAYNLFVNEIENNCVTHAYLVDENNYSDSFNMILSFVKAILCKNKCVDKCKSLDCSICKRIDEGNYPEVKIIMPDGMYIKKQQIIDLQQEFSRTAVEGLKRVYIIRDCEKMRHEAANSMLKFLEEPQDGIIAILMTNNINNVLSTIISRCKIVKLNNVIGDLSEDNDVIEKLALEFITSLENKGIDTIIDAKELWFSVIGIKEREKIINAFDVMIDIYYDVMKVISGSDVLKYYKLNDRIQEFAKLNKLVDVINKINILMEAKESVKFNVNSNLLIDSVIISIGGVISDSRY